MLIPWYLTLNSQVLLPQAVHVTYANGIEEKQREISAKQEAAVSNHFKLKRHKDVLPRNKRHKKGRIEISA